MTRAAAGRGRRSVLAALSLLLALTLVAGLPRLVGTGWAQALTVLRRLEPSTVLALTVLWATGLWIYTWVSTGTLPGLRHHQALTLNLTGSLVSNVLPFGGAAGVATTYAVATGWGFAPGPISLMVLATGMANLAIRLVLPAVSIAALLATGLPLPPRGLAAALIALAVLAAVAVAGAGLLVSPRAARRFGQLADTIAGALATVLRRRPPGPLQNRAVAVQAHARTVLYRGWPSLTFGMIGYYTTEAVLLYITVSELNQPLPWPRVLAAFTLSRLLTSAVITPSGLGISETGTTALLVAFGLPPAVAVAAVLVLNFYTYLIELPAGLIAWSAVLIQHRRRS